MVDQFAVVEFTTPATATNLEITSPSITEPFSCAVFIVSASTTDSSDSTHGQLSIGFCTANGSSASQGSSCGHQLESGVSTIDNGTQNNYGAGTPDVISVPLGTAVATQVIAAKFSAAVSGGVRLNFGTTTVQGKGVALLFAGLSDSACNNVSVTTTEAQVNVAASGGGQFQPDALIWLTHDHPGGSAFEAEAQPNLGFSVRNGSAAINRCAFINMDDGGTTVNTDGAVRTDAAFGWLNLTTRVAEYGGVTEFNATGFKAQANASVVASWLAIKFSGTVTAGTEAMSVAASTGTQALTGLGTAPEVVLGMATRLTSQDTLVDGSDAAAFGYFMFTSAEARAYSSRFRRTTTTEASTRQEDAALLLYNNTGSVVQRASLVTLDGDGFSLSFSVGSEAGTIVAIGFGGGTQTAVSDDTERVSDGSILNLISYLVLGDTVALSDGLGGLELADGLTALQDTGSVFQGGAHKGTVLQGGAVAGVVEG